MKSEWIPENEEGQETNTESKVQFNSADEASEFFLIIKKRLFNVNEWHDLAGQATSVFQLTDENGKDVHRWVKQGDYFRISIPAPGPVTGDGYDWVRVEDVEEKENFSAIKVRPASNPLKEKEDIAHFFHKDATSSFIIKKKGNTITAGIYGRNEKPNTSTEKTIDKIRNTAIATGAIAGLAKIQWKRLVDGFTAALE